MSIIVSQKNTFNIKQLDHVTSITFNDNIYTIIAGGTTLTYSKDSYIIFIIN